MSKSKRDTHGNRRNGEISYCRNSVLLRANGTVASRHDGGCAQPSAKHWAKRMVARARRRLAVEECRDL